MLDIDLAIIDCPDELFELEAPAALRRGIFCHEHGALIDGRLWFCGQDYGWAQSGGINAGVMLLAPNSAVFARTLQEVRSPLHPEHIAGSGPEQDYLSRLYANCWHHISVRWNWQLHQMFHALESVLANESGVAACESNSTSGLLQHGDAMLSEMQDVQAGSKLFVFRTPPGLDQLPAFASPYSFHIVDNADQGNMVVAVGSPIISGGCPMVPIEKPSGYVDGRCLRPVSDSSVPSCSSSSRAQTSEVVSQKQEPEQKTSTDLDSESRSNEWQDWLPERINTDLDDVHIFHFSGELKMWDRYLEATAESDEVFVERFLNVNTNFYTRLFVQRAGTTEEYEHYGVKLVDGRWEPEAVGAKIEKSVKKVREAALKATQRWHQDFQNVLWTLGCSQEALVNKLQNDRVSISSGTRITCAQERIVIWSSVHDWTEVGGLQFGQEVLAEGPAEFSEGYWMLPIRTENELQGVVDLRSVKPL